MDYLSFKTKFRDWIDSTVETNIENFAWEIELNEDVCENVAKAFMKSEKIPKSEMSQIRIYVYDWASDFTEFCGAGL